MTTASGGAATMYVPATAHHEADGTTWDEATRKAAFLHRFALNHANTTWHLYIHKHIDTHGAPVWGIWADIRPGRRAAA